MSGVSCGECAFFSADESVGGMTGDCRAHPPMASLPAQVLEEMDDGSTHFEEGPAGLAVWPVVEASSWCGEWSPLVRGIGR